MAINGLKLARVLQSSSEYDMSIRMFILENVDNFFLIHFRLMRAFYRHKLENDDSKQVN